MRTILLMVFVLCMLTGCLDEPKVQRGDVVGNIGFYEKEFVNYIDSLVGVNVTLTSTSGVFETTSLSDGTFRFENVAAGNYKVTMNKDFFAYYRNGIFYPKIPDFELTHIGGGTTNIGGFELYEYPEYTTIIESYEWASDTALVLHLSIPPSEQDYYTFNVYLSNDETVGTTDFDYVWKSGDSNSYFDDAIVVDTTQGKVALKLPFYKYEVNHYFAVSATSVWSYELAGPSSTPILIRP